MVKSNQDTLKCVLVLKKSERGGGGGWSSSGPDACLAPDSSERLLLAGNQIERRVIYISCTTALRWRQGAFKSRLRSTGNSVALITTIPSLISQFGRSCRKFCFWWRVVARKLEVNEATVIRRPSWHLEEVEIRETKGRQMSLCGTSMSPLMSAVHTQTGVFLMNYSSFSPVEANPVAAPQGSELRILNIEIMNWLWVAQSTG